MHSGLSRFAVLPREGVYREIPILFPTAHPPALLEKQAKELQPVTSLTKPPKIEKLVATLGTLVAGAGKQR